MARRRQPDEDVDEDELDAEDGAWEDLFDGVPEASDARALSRGLAFGFLAMVPLFVLYELGTAGSGQRSAAELVLLRPLAPLGDQLPFVRVALLAGLAALALAWCVRRHLALGPRLVRVPVEGLLGALFLGPATVLLMQVFAAAPLAVAGEASGGVPTFERAAFVAGAAAYEEVVFRVGLFSLVWLVTRRVLAWLGAGDRAARWSAEVLAPVGSALLFAAFHLEAFLGLFGPGGEPFDLALFSWRTFAGVLLALLFRWRGPGVAAWTHACFNVSLLLGAGPRVFL
jgi:hypothetical protein